MHKGLFAFTVLISFQAAFSQGWVVDWSDEFDYTGLPDTSNWRYTAGREGAQANGFSTTARPENYEVRDGSLFMMARKETLNGKPYTQPFLDTWRKHEFRFGRFEARLKAPESKSGIWPAFWALGGFAGWQQPGGEEVDIWEWGLGANQAGDPTAYNRAFWINGTCGFPNGAKFFHYPDSVSPQDWHVYSWEWHPDGVMKFAIDDSVWDSSSPFDTSGCVYFKRPLFILLDVVIGGAAGSVSPDITWPATMEVDYVRHYFWSETRAGDRRQDSRGISPGGVRITRRCGGEWSVSLSRAGDCKILICRADGATVTSLIAHGPGVYNLSRHTGMKPGAYILSVTYGREQTSRTLLLF
jgi:beta-glucanase (GH16 family)